jgi:ABC-2 type transport system ATP-binding protein
MKIIKVENLAKTYLSYRRGNSFFETMKSLVVRRAVEVKALKGISFDVDKGELIGFLGPNGAGKSTTLKILTGILFPSSGKADVMGYCPWLQRKAYVSHIGAVFGQKSQLIWDIPPIDSFHMNRAIYSIPVAKFKNRLDRLINMLNIEELIGKPTRQLSLGERMKCEFIMAMLHDPEIVFLDEPTIGLDVVAKEKIREFIKEMNSKGTTFILTTHDLDDVERLAKRVIVVNSGEIVFDDSMEALHGFFGNKKYISITLQEGLPDFASIPGVTIKSLISASSAEIELDTDTYSLNRFIQTISENCIINDMTIGEVAIESVVRELYVRKQI